MAVNSLIKLLDRLGLDATVEHEDGTWSHTPEYNALRFGGVAGLASYLEQQQEELAHV